MILFHIFASHLFCISVVCFVLTDLAEFCCFFCMTKEIFDDWIQWKMVFVYDEGEVYWI